MATKRQVRAALARIGGTWDEAYDTFDAPAGQLWEASCSHGLPAAYDPLQSIPENYDGFIAEIDLGVYACDEPDCEVCYPDPEP